MKRYFSYTICLVVLLWSIITAWTTNQQPPRQWTTIRIKNISGCELLYVAFHYNKSPTDTNWLFPFFLSHQKGKSLKPGDTATAEFAIDNDTHTDYYDYRCQCGDTTILKRVDEPFTVKDGGDTTILLSGSNYDEPLTHLQQNKLFQSYLYSVND